jgi:outer membrane protein
MYRRIFHASLCLASAAPFVAPQACWAGDLLNVYHLAQQQDMTLQAALYQRQASIEAHPQALAALLPQLSATAGAERDRSHQLSQNRSLASSQIGTTVIGAGTTGTQYYNQESYSLNLSQTVFDWSSFKALAAANQQVAQAQATYRAAEQTLIYRVADAYFTALNAEDTLHADMDAQAAYKQQLDQAQKKFEVGLAAITDVRNAQASYDTSRATVIADQRLVDSAKRSLGQLTGRTMEEVATLREEIPLEAPNPAAETDWVKAAMQDNPTLLSYAYAEKAAQKNIESIRGRYLPSLSVVGSAQRQKSDSSYSGDAIGDAIGLQLNWNVFQGGLVRSEVRQATANYEQAKAQYEGQRRGIDQSARDAYEGVMSGIASVKAGRQAVLSNETSLEATQVGLRVGTRTEIDVLTAQQALAAAQRTYYQSRYDYLRSLLSLKQQAGRLSEADLAAIDDLLVAPGTQPAPSLAPPPGLPAPVVAPPSAAPQPAAPAVPAAPAPAPAAPQTPAGAPAQPATK